MSVSGLYGCFNFSLRSELPLHELAPAVASSFPAVIVRLGRLPAFLPDAELSHGIHVTGDTVLLTVRGIARYRIRGGREIVIDPAPGGSERNIRLFLLGSALGILCHQRGLLPLHANAIVAGEAAHAFAGPSGAGKSTLAAHFARAGYEVLCDDVCVISFDEAGIPSAWPGLPRLKLWGDAAVAFGHDPSSLDAAIEGLEKYYVPLAPAGPSRPIPFRRLYLLRKSADDVGVGVSQVYGRQAMAAAMSQTYRHEYLGPMGLLEQNFRQCATLISSVEVYEVHRAWGYDVLEKQGRLLEEHILGHTGRNACP